MTSNTSVTIDSVKVQDLLNAQNNIVSNGSLSNNYGFSISPNSTIQAQIATIKQSILGQTSSSAYTQPLPAMVSMERLLNGDLDFTKEIFYFKGEVNEVTLWRFFVWAYGNKDINDYALIADHKSVMKYTLMEKYVAIAFGSKKTYEAFDTWMKTYDARFGKGIKIPTPYNGITKINGTLVKYDFVLPDVKQETQPFAMSEDQLREWSWIVQHVKFNVIMLPGYWVFENEGDAVHFKLSFDKSDK